MDKHDHSDENEKEEDKEKDEIDAQTLVLKFRSKTDSPVKEGQDPSEYQDNDTNVEEIIHHETHSHHHSDSEEEDPIEGEEKRFIDYIIIPYNSGWKQNYDIIMMILVAYSCMTSMYYVAFSEPTSSVHKSIDWVVEGFFYMDIALSFIHAYQEPETQRIVTNFRMIALRYLRSWFFVDFISVFPFYIFLPTGVLTRLLRLLRLPRLAKLLDVTHFERVLRGLFGTDVAIDGILQLSFIKFLYEIFQLVLVALIVTYLIGCTQFFLSDFLNSTSDIKNGKTFLTSFDIKVYDEEGEPLPQEQQHYAEWEMAIISCYFALTTLSTVGYGDYSPISNLEMLFTVMVQLGAIALFSTIMQKFFLFIGRYYAKITIPTKKPKLH